MFTANWALDNAYIVPQLDLSCILKIGDLWTWYNKNTSRFIELLTYNSIVHIK